MSETAVPYHSCRQPCEQHTVCPIISISISPLPTIWPPANSAEVVFLPSGSVTVSRADLEMFERFAWAGYTAVRYLYTGAEQAKMDALFVRLAGTLRQGAR